MKTVKKSYRTKENNKEKAVTPRNMNYPPKYSPNNNPNNKSWNFYVSNPGFGSGKPRHRRNISSGYNPVTISTTRREREGHGFLMQYQKSPVQRLETDEASNFNCDEIDETQSQWVPRNDKSQTQREQYTDPGVYSSKYSYKSYLEQQSKFYLIVNI